MMVTSHGNLHSAEANIFNGATMLLQMFGHEVDIDQAELMDDVSVSDDLVEQLHMFGYL